MKFNDKTYFGTVFLGASMGIPIAMAAVSTVLKEVPLPLTTAMFVLTLFLLIFGIILTVIGQKNDNH